MIALLPPLHLPRREASRPANSMQWPLLCKCEGPTPPRGDAKKPGGTWLWGISGGGRRGRRRP
jgi:hypothetical protein